jgi:hypothetical protein
MFQLLACTVAVGFASEMAAWCFDSGTKSQRRQQRKIAKQTRRVQRSEAAAQHSIVAGARREIRGLRNAAHQAHREMLGEMWKTIQGMRRKSLEVKGGFREIIDENRRLMRTLALTPQQRESILECNDLLERGVARLEAYAGPYLQIFQEEIKCAQRCLKDQTYITPEIPEERLPWDFPYAGELLEFEPAELGEYPVVKMGFGQTGRFVTPRLEMERPEGPLTAFVRRYDSRTSRWVLSEAQGCLALDLKTGDAHRRSRLVTLSEKRGNQRTAWWEHDSGERLLFQIPDGCLSTELRHAPSGTPVEVFIHRADLMLKALFAGDQVEREYRRPSRRVPCHAPADFWQAYGACAQFSSQVIIREAGLREDPSDAQYILRLSSGAEFPVEASAEGACLVVLPQCGMQLGLVQDNGRTLLVYSLRAQLCPPDEGDTNGGYLLTEVAECFEEQRDLTRLDDMDSLELQKYGTVLQAEFETNQWRDREVVDFSDWVLQEFERPGETVVSFTSEGRLPQGSSVRYVGDEEVLGWVRGGDEDAGEIEVALLPRRRRDFVEGTFPLQGRLEAVPTEGNLQKLISAMENFRSSSLVNSRTQQDQEAFCVLRRELLGRFQDAVFEGHPSKESCPASLDEHQQRAVHMLSGNAPLVLIQGPPGTGKTHVIAHALRAVLKRNPSARIALVSQANPAVDEAVAKILECAPELTIYRDLSASAREKYESNGGGVGLEESYHELLDGVRAAPVPEDQSLAGIRDWLLCRIENEDDALKRDLSRSRVRHSQITACTLSRLAVIGAHAPPFDLVIVDEAAKASVPETLIAAVCARRLALVGDHHQLLPFMDESFCEHSAPSAADKESLRELWNHSLFYRLWDVAPESRKSFLALMRRSRKPIAECISTCFYERTLVPGRGHDSPTLNSPVSLMWVDSSSFRHCRVAGTTLENEGEADLVLQALREVDKLRKASISVGVITFHRGQAALLNRKLKQARFSFTPMILTVDASQGGQWDVVVLSLGRTSGSSGFIGNPNRLNVAISRAKELCVFVGSLRYAARDATPGSSLGAVAEFVTAGADNGKRLCIPASGGRILPGFESSAN